MSGKARRVATAGVTSSGVAGSPSNTPATASIHSRGTASGFKFDQAMACKLLRRAANGAKASRRRSAKSRWIGCRLRKPAQLAFQLGAIGGRQIDQTQPFTEDAGQRRGPVTMPADDPRRRLLQARVRPRPAVPRRTSGRDRPPSIWSSATIAALTVRGLSLDSPASVPFGSPISINA